MIRAVDGHTPVQGPRTGQEHRVVALLERPGHVVALLGRDAVHPSIAEPLTLEGLLQLPGQLQLYTQQPLNIFEPTPPL